jgi:hypothetical protein
MRAIGVLATPHSENVYSENLLANIEKKREPFVPAQSSYVCDSSILKDM